MAESGKKGSEKQLWHFGFTALDLNDNFREFWEDTVDSALEELKKGLVDESHDEETVSEQISHFKELYKTKAQSALDKFQEAADEIFQLPKDLTVLSVNLDFELPPQITSEELNELEKEVKQLENQYFQEVLYRKHLEAKLEKFEHYQSYYEKVANVLRNVDNIKKLSGPKSPSDLFECCKQLEELLVSKLEEKEDEGDLINYANLF